MPKQTGKSINVAGVGDSMDAGIIKRSRVNESFPISGEWEYWNRSPLIIPDRDKAVSLLAQAQHVVFPNLITDGFLWLKQWRQIKGNLFQTHRRIFDELERMLQGGRLEWHFVSHNVVVDVGLTDMLEKYFNGSTYTAAHYVGLTDAAPVSPATGDTMSSHAGWTEDQNYSEGTRVTYNPGAAAAKSIDNSGNKADFSINGTTTIGGAFLSTDNTKGGTSGTLISVDAFTGGDKAVGSGDTLSVQITYTAADT